MVVVYVAVIRAEGTATIGQILPWALLMAAAALVALISTRVPDRRRAGWVLLGAAGLFGVLGVLSLFTIGIGFFLAAALAGIGALRLLMAPSGGGVAG